MNITWLDADSEATQVTIIPATSQPERECWEQTEESGNTVIKLRDECSGTNVSLPLFLPGRTTTSLQGERTEWAFPVQLIFPGQDATSRDRTSVFTSVHYYELDIPLDYSLEHVGLYESQDTGCRRDTDRADDLSWRCDPMLWVGSNGADELGPVLPGVAFSLRPEWFALVQQVELILLAIVTGVVGSAVVALATRT